jgi:manganese/zinc/iron transport system substrate-binding protein
MTPPVVARGAERARRADRGLHPEEADTFRANADRISPRSARWPLYTATRAVLVPPRPRAGLTAHDAFNYFGSAYGFEVLGIQGISTESEAGLKRIAELVDMLVDRDIGAVFVESSVSDRNIRALIEGAARAGHEVTSGASFSPTRWASPAPMRAPISA